MLSLFRWLFRAPRFTRFDDSYAMTHDRLWELLRKAIQLQQSEGYRVWLVAHFAETFFWLQERMAESGLDYRITDRQLAPSDALNIIRTNSTEAANQLALAELLLSTSTQPTPFDQHSKISVIVIERHPQIQHDWELESFARSIPCIVRFGYFLTLDDTVIQRVVPENMYRLLDLMGAGQHEMISSNMLTRGLEKALRKQAQKIHSDHPAESAKRWYELNIPDSN